MNLYRYGENNPASMVDLLGLDSFLLTFDPVPIKFIGVGIPHTAIEIHDDQGASIYTFDPGGNLQRYDNASDFWNKRNPKQSYYRDRFDPNKVEDKKLREFYEKALKDKVKYLKGRHVCSTQALEAIMQASDFQPSSGAGVPAKLRKMLKDEEFFTDSNWYKSSPVAKPKSSKIRN